MDREVIYVVPAYGKKQYGCMSFLFDCFMVIITAGFWLIWILVRELRKNN